MKKVFEKIVLAILIIILLYSFISKYILKNKLTTVFGYGFLIVVTGSMEPTIKPGELVVIKQSNRYNENDIITYELEDYLVTHRIVKITEKTFIANGDNNNENDTQLKNDNIIGKVVYHSAIIRKLYY